MYQLPSSVSNGFVTTNAVAGTVNTVTWFPAPGVGVRFRLTFAMMAPIQTNTGIVLLHIQPGVNQLGDLTVFNSSVSIIYPEPGVLLAGNTAFTISNVSNVASQTIWLTFGYYQENV
jgi:hypothetical protein